MAKALKNPDGAPGEGSGTGSGVMCAGLCGCCVSMFEYNAQNGGLIQKAVVVEFEFVTLSKPFTKRHLDGRKRARVVISGRVARRDLLFCCFIKYKVPHPYSRAGKNARSLTGIRDDDSLFSELYDYPKTTYLHTKTAVSISVKKSMPY
jgi:hypothetical protein